jgi:hypothetical protein
MINATMSARQLLRLSANLGKRSNRNRQERL